MSDGNNKIKFWGLPISSNSAVVRSFLLTTGIDFEEVNAWGHTRTPEYVAKFPNNCAPAIEHGDVCLAESASILRYLARAFPDKAGRYYPEDPGSAGKVDMVCDMINTGVCGYLPKAVYPTLSFPVYPGDVGAIDELKDQYTDVAAKAAQEALMEYLTNKVVGILLKDSKFLCGNEPTIADFRFAPMISQIKIAGKLPAELEEYEKAMMDLPGYAEGTKPADDYNSPHWK
jgi:glutathione S-transferase